MAGFSTATKTAMLDAITMNRIRLHSGDPGAAGTSNQLGAGLSTAVFDAAASGSRALNAAVAVTGLTANQSVTYFSVWTAAGSVFVGSGTIATGDLNANSSGDYTLEVGTTVSVT